MDGLRNRFPEDKPFQPKLVQAHAKSIVLLGSVVPLEVLSYLENILMEHGILLFRYLLQNFLEVRDS